MRPAKPSAAVVRRERACAWASEIGGSHGLGECRDVYGQVHGRISARGCGRFLILAAILIGIPFAGSGP